MKLLNETNCLTELYYDKNITRVQAECNFRYKRNNLESQIIEISPTEVLLYNTEHFMINCKGETFEVQGCKSWFVKPLSCMCTIANTNAHYVGRYHHVFCGENITEVQTSYPVNLALLSHFFNHTYLTQMLRNVSLKDPMKILIPEFRIYDHDISNTIADDKKSALSLKKMAKRAKLNRVICTNLDDTLLDGEVILDPPINKWHIMSIVSMSCLVAHT